MGAGVPYTSFVSKVGPKRYDRSHCTALVSQHVTWADDDAHRGRRAWLLVQKLLARVSDAH